MDVKRTPEKTFKRKNDLYFNMTHPVNRTKKTRLRLVNGNKGAH